MLGLGHRPEGALQLFARQRREIAGIDPVVGLGPGVDLGRLVLQAEPRHQGERLEERGDGVSLECSGGLRGVQAADRARDRDPGLKRMEPGQVRDRDDPAALQVDAAVVTERQAAAEPRRRREVGGRSRQPADEVGVVRGPPLDLDKRAHDLEAADHVAEVEGHGRADEMAAVGVLQAVVEHPHPFRLREPPDAVSRQHLGVVGTEAAARQCDVDLPCDVGEVRVDLGAAGVGVGERVVLVGGQGCLAPGGRSEREPRPRDGGRPALGGDELDQPRRRCVGLERDHPAHVER